MSSNFSNGTTTNDQGSSESVSTVAYTVLLLIGGIPALTNVTYIIVCFRIFSKKFHKLLILCLCLSGSCQGFSTVWFSIMAQHNSVLSTPIACSFSNLLLVFGLLSSYGFLCLLNLVSYLTIKSYNFGIREKLEKLKVPLLSGILVGSVVISCVIWIIPHSHTIKTCSSITLFKEHFSLFVSLVLLPMNLLLSATFFTSILSVCQIYSIFFKTKVAPRRRIAFFANKEDIQHVEPIDTQIKSRFSTNDLSLSKSFGTSKERGKSKFLTNDLSLQTESPVLAIQCAVSTNSHEVTIATGSETQCSGLSIQYSGEANMVPGATKQPSISTISCEVFDPSKITRPVDKWNSWEMNAFITNLVFTTTTILLTGPFIFVTTFVLAIGQISYAFGFFSFILLNINTAVSPFIYAWRIPDIRHQLKKV